MTQTRSQENGYHEKRSMNQAFFPLLRALLLLPGVLLLLAVPLPVYAQAGDAGQRQDEIARTPDPGDGSSSRIGVNERGDDVMEVRPRPKAQQKAPPIGPIYVTPFVNTPGAAGATTSGQYPSGQYPATGQRPAGQ